MTPRAKWCSCGSGWSRIGRLLAVVGLIAGSSTTSAQDVSPIVEFGSQRSPIRISAQAVFEHYKSGSIDLRETSFPVTATIPLGRRLGLQLSGNAGLVSGSDLASIQSIGDFQTSLGYGFSLGKASVVATATANLPSGKDELTSEELETTILLSQHAFDFGLPSFGQGMQFASQVGFAYPFGDQFAVGAGIAYHLRGGFKPVIGLEDDYIPGNELMFVLGADVRISSVTTASVDVGYAQYAVDKLGSDDFFELGDKTTATVKVQSRPGSSRVVIVGRVQRWADSRFVTEDVSEEGAAVSTSQRSLPTQFLGSGLYEFDASSRIRLGVMVQARLLAEVGSFRKTSGELIELGSKEIVSVGVLPLLRVSRQTAVTSRFVYSAVGITGIEAGVGLVLTI